MKSAVAIVAIYGSEPDALSDFNAVERHYTNDLGIDGWRSVVVLTQPEVGHDCLAC
jgi:hypothetical protein